MVCCRCDHQMPRIEIIANNYCDEQEVDVIAGVPEKSLK